MRAWPLFPLVLLGTTAAQGGKAAAEKARLGPVTAIVATSDRLVSCSQSGVWIEVKDGSVRGEVSFRAFTVAAKDGFLLVGGGRPGRSGRIALLDARGHRLAERRLASDLVYATALSPRARLGAAGCADGRVLLFELPGLERIREVQRHSAPCRAVAFSPDGKRILSGGLDGNLLLKTVGRDTPARVLQDHTAGVECLVWAADGSRFASGARDGKVRVHHANGRLVRTYLKLGEAVTALAHDGLADAFLAGLRDGSVWFLQPSSARARRLKGPGEPIYSLASSPKGADRKARQATSTLLLGLSGRIARLEIAGGPSSRPSKIRGVPSSAETARGRRD